MTVREMIKQWLKNNNYDGLYNPHRDCWCLIDDLFWCGDNPTDCCSYRKEYFKEKVERKG